MKYLLSIIKNLLPKELPKPVGRWKVEKCDLLINNKIDSSNEDHCGPCGQISLKKVEKINSKTDGLLKMKNKK